MSTSMRIAFVLGLTTLLSSTLWTLQYQVEGNYSDAPAWLNAGLRALSPIGMVLLAWTAWRWLRRRAMPLPVSTLNVFRPQHQWMLELAVWAFLPVVPFSVLILATQLALPAIPTAILLVVSLLAWPVFLSLLMTRYEITASGLRTGSFLASQSVPWDEVWSVQTLHTPFGEQIEFRRGAGRPVRIFAPAERDRFLAEVRRHAPKAVVNA